MTGVSEIALWRDLSWWSRKKDSW